MVTAQIPPSIQASIHQDAINRVSQFFNATTADILNELLQNARRSGASRVDVTGGDGRVTIADDGQGIKDPAAILAFGQTAWDKHTEQSEHPAGMGLYALARRELVTVRSKSGNGHAWQVNLTPDHFVGKIPAPVDRMPEDGTPPGTTVTFTSKQTSENIEKEVQTAAKYYPLPVRFNGHSVEQATFLQQAEYTQEWRGIRIGVYNNTKDLMNFHGIVVNYPNLPTIETIDRQTWTAKADVMDCPQLELTLPARREVVETPFMEELRQACRRAIYQTIALQPDPVDVPKQMQEEAATMGIALPDAAPKLAKWHPSNADDSYHRPSDKREQVQDDTIVLDLDMSPTTQQTLARAAGNNGTLNRLYEPNHQLIGYDWYDQLTKANNVRITITDQDGDQDLDKTETNQPSPERLRPDGIVFTLETTQNDSNNPEHQDDPEDQQDAPVKIIALPSDLAFEHQEYNDLYEAVALVTKNSTINVYELSELIMDGFFCPSDDRDADSYDTQRSDAQIDSETSAIRLLSSQDEAIKATIANTIEHHVIYQIPKGMTATIRVSRRKLIEVTLEPEEKEEEE